MFTDRMPDSEINFQGYGQWSYNDLLINGGKLYFVSQATTTFTKFGVPIFGEDYYAEPFIGLRSEDTILVFFMTSCKEGSCI